MPFALLEPAEWKFRSGMDIPPEVRELWVSDPSCDGPVHAIEIEGSAVPKRRASKVVARRSMLKFEEPALEPKPRPARAPKGGPSFDAERAVLSQITSDGPTRSAALGLLQRLGGWKSKKPLQIDPRWVTALKEVLLQAVLAKDGSAATQVATTLDVYDPEGAHMASVVTEVVGRSPASNDLHALTEVFRQLSSKGPAGVDGAMQLLTKAGKRATAIDDELIDYLAYGGSARHLGPLKAVKKLRRFKKIDVALDWVSFRAASPKKKFTWHSNPHLD